MSFDETARHRLFNKATEVLGAEEAEILMAHLPPGGWPNLATKQDVLLVKQDLRGVEDGLRREMASVEQRLKAYTLRTILAANLGMAAAFAAIAFTAAGVGA